MSDGKFSAAAQLVGEAVIKPVTDEVGKMVETGVQSVAGSQKQDDSQKKQNALNAKQVAQDDAAKKRKVLMNIAQFNQQYTQQSQALKQQRLQEQQQKTHDEQQKEQQIRQFEFVKKQKQMDMKQAELMRAKTKSERKGGAG